MLKVQISVNDDVIYTLRAERHEKLSGKNKIYHYQVLGKTIKHKYSDGAKKLAIKMLKIK